MEDYIISIVTSVDDVESLATVFMQATKGIDSFWEMMERYGPAPPYDALLTALQDSVGNSNHHVLKVVERTSGRVVGMAQWRAPCYVEIDKVDPFAEEETECLKASDGGVVAPLMPAVGEPVDPYRAAGVAVIKGTWRQVTNAYIRHIRGKKHARELLVHCTGCCAC